MDPAKDGFGNVPLSGLGNYKGVMLCNRPPDDMSKTREDGTQPPFKSTVAAVEQLGLAPPRRAEAVGTSSEVKLRGPSAALRRHCRWIKELQEQVRQDRQSAEDGVSAQEARQARMAEVFKQQRDAVRQIKFDRDVNDIHPDEIEAIIKPKSKGASGGSGAQKPLWAMTEAERDGAEEVEADDLIRFAEDLNFDQYIGDLEFRECLQVMKDRAKKLQKEQDAFKDSILKAFNDEVAGEDDNLSDLYEGSVMSDDRASRLRARQGAPDRPDWDSSTACGEDNASCMSKGARAAAEDALMANPKLRGVHSKASMQRIVEKASEAGDLDT